MASSLQWCDFVRVLATDRELPIGHQFVTMKLYPRLDQTQLLTRQVTSKNLTVFEVNGCLEFSVFGVNMWQIVVLVVDQVRRTMMP
jgi:hypothetical protein